MAKIFKVHGTEQREPHVVEWPWPKCVAAFDLDGASATEERPKFGEKDTFPWPSDVVIYLEDAEARQYGAKLGYYASPLPIHEAEERLDAGP